MTMPPRFFERNRDYPQLLSGAHRKPATPIHTPSLSLHLAFWQPRTSNENQPSSAQNDNTWKNNIDRYIHAIFRQIRDLDFYSPNTDARNFNESRYLFLFGNAIDLKSCDYEIIPSNSFSESQNGSDRSYYNIDEYFNSVYQALVFFFSWRGCKATLRFEKHHEYVTITAFLDFSRSIPAEEDDVTDKVQRYIKDINESAERTSQTMSDRQAIRDRARREREAVAPAHKFLYSDIWDSFIDEILLSRVPLKYTSANGLSRTCDGRSLLGTVFADFRGAVLSPDKLGERAVPFENIGNRVTKSARLGAGEIFTSNISAATARAVWPFLTSETRAPFRRYEFTVSRMLGGRAIYTTALGAQPSPYLSASEDGERELPLYFLIIVTSPSKWQIGRLVDRIHQLGTVRIAAIQENRLLREVSRRINDLSERIDQDLGPLRIGGSNILHSTERRIAERLVQIQSDVLTLNDDFHSGLYYRIERSRYYVKQFFDGLPLLRIRRVEGFQPYDVFVKNRLDATFVFIDMLGTQLERLEEKQRSIYQYAVALGSARSVRLIADIQVAAEAFVWCLAAPYYTFNLAEHLLKYDISWAYVVPAVLAGSVLLAGLARVRHLWRS